MPEAGTIRDLSIMVGHQAVTEPTNSNTYEWRDQMAPGQSQEAVVRYRVLGARFWRYELGSQRRRVQQFVLEARATGPVRFLRGSLQPTTDTGGVLRWELTDVVTAQQVAIAFPPDTLGKQLYLQALSALPLSFILFLVGVLAVGLWLRQVPGPTRLLAGLVLFAFGLGTSTVATIYLGSVAGVIIGPLLGAVLAATVLGRASLLAAVPVALLPAAFLSAQDSGLLVFALTLLTLAAVSLMGHFRSSRPAPPRGPS